MYGDPALHDSDYSRLVMNRLIYRARSYDSRRLYVKVPKTHTVAASLCKELGFSLAPEAAAQQMITNIMCYIYKEMTDMRIVIGSAGRRVYLVRWFQQALRAAGIEGEVIVMENDPNAPSVAVADRFVRMPRYETQQYRQRLLTALAE